MITRLETLFPIELNIAGVISLSDDLDTRVLARRRYSDSHLVDVSCRPQHPPCNVIYFQVYDPRDSPRGELIAATGADSQRQREYTNAVTKIKQGRSGISTIMT